MYISLNTAHITGRDVYEELLQLKLQGWNTSVLGFLICLVSKSSPVLGLNFLRGVYKARAFFICSDFAVCCFMAMMNKPIGYSQNF